MKKNLIAASILALCAFAASAQSIDYRLENSGHIVDRVSTSASVVDNGTSNSVARASGSAAASGYVTTNPIAGGQALTLGGATEVTSTAMAFNVSTGNGTGAASANGTAAANVNGFNTFTNSNGFITMAGATDQNIGVNVSAGRSQDGFANAAAGGSFNIAGATQQLPVAGGATVAGWVADTKESHASVAAGGVTFTDGTPAGQTAATRGAVANSATEASASFDDPVIAK